MTVTKMGMCAGETGPIPITRGSYEPDMSEPKLIFIGVFMVIVVMTVIISYFIWSKKSADAFVPEYLEWESKNRPLTTGGHPRWNPVSPSGIPEQINVADGLTKNEQPRLIYSFPYDDIATAQHVVLNETTGRPLIKETKTRYTLYPSRTASAASRRISETKIEQHEKFTESRVSDRIDRNLNHRA